MSNPNPSPATRFPAQNNANPGGKPVNLRNSLNARFLKVLSAEFDRVGKEAITIVAKTDPATFLRVIAALQPKEMEVKRSLDDITDEQLDAAAIAIRAILNAQNSGSREKSETRTEQAQELQTLPETT